MAIIHLVLFGFGPEVKPEMVREVCCLTEFLSLALRSLISSQVCKQMLGLKEECVHPTKSTRYIKTSMGGRDNSPENRQVDGPVFSSWPVIQSLWTYAKSTMHRTARLMPLLWSLRMRQIEITMSRKTRHISSL